MTNLPNRLDTTVTVMIIAALRAGADIMAVYRNAITVAAKDDGSPLTEADRRSHDRINTVLEAAMTRDEIPRTPILSEEGSSIPHEERSAWRSFYMVDPLDGTKEFIKRNDEFTVNIAYVEQSEENTWYPRLGVVYAPALEELFVGQRDSALSWSGIAPTDEVPPLSKATPLPSGARARGRPFTVVASRSHLSPETRAFIDDRRSAGGDIRLVSAGSSLKLCRVADGSADEYPRFAPTMEWDTAAGDAIARSSGCTVHRWDARRHEVGAPLDYNKKDLHNPWFLVRRDTRHS